MKHKELLKILGILLMAILVGVFTVALLEHVEETNTQDNTHYPTDVHPPPPTMGYTLKSTRVQMEEHIQPNSNKVLA